MTENLRAEVVIAGAGIIGCLTAYYLAQRGLTVIVVDPDGIGSAASGGAGGILTPYSGSMAPELLALSPATLALHSALVAQLLDETGIDYGYELIPHLRLVFTEDGASRLRAWQDARAADGLASEWLEPREARILAPWITGDVLGGLRSEIEPQLDAYQFVLAVASAAEKRGSRFVSGRVSGLLGPRGSAVRGVTLQDGSAVEADTVVLAMGPWAKFAGEWLGLEIPVAPQRGQILELDTGGDSAVELPAVGVFAWDVGGYVLPKRSGETLLGTTRELGEFDPRVTPEGRRLILDYVQRISTRLGAAQITGERACVRPLSLDGIPFIGEVPGWPGVFLAAGHGPEGVHFGPVTGLGLAELIVDGNSQFDLAPFSPARLARIS